MPERAGHSDGRQATKGRPRVALDQRMMTLFGTDWCGNDAPPLTNRKMYVHDDGVYRVFSMVDDGGFVGVGYPDQWHVIMRTEAARWFAWWTFKTWVTDWFGLRSHLYYVALHHKVKGEWKLSPYRHKRRVWPSSHDAWHASGERV